MQILFLALMFVLGAIFGSFLCCQARRLHEGQRRRVTTTKEHQKVASDALTVRSIKRQLPHRSICLHCNKQLNWYDNIPIVSWLILRGKCRFCHQKIGLAELISELSVSLAFLAIGFHFLQEAHAFTPNILAPFPSITPMDWAIFIITLLLTISLAFLAIYDGLYGELPSLCLTISAICAIILVILQLGDSFLVVGFFDSQIAIQKILMPILSSVLFGGIYLALYSVSKGKWVGDGDWLLAGIIGLALGHPWLSLVALFIANLLATVIMYPAVKGKKNHQIYFGPFLVLAFVITYVFSSFLISVI